MNRTPSPPPVSGNHARLPLFLPSPPGPKRHDFGIRRLAGLPHPPPSSAASAAPKEFGFRGELPPDPASPPVPEKKSFGIRSRLPQLPPSAPVAKKDFGIRSRLPQLPPSAPVPKNDFGIRAGVLLSPPSAPPKKDFGIRSRVPKMDFGVRAGSPPSPPPPVPKQNYGLRAAIFETQEASSSLSLHAEDFGVSVPEEGPSQIGSHQPTEAGEPLGSSSNMRSEFHILTFMRILFIYMQPGDGENQHHLP
jgi:hypothetical protein